MSTDTYTWESKVRDYELDSLGIVNHAIFIHYMEQCRNDYARFINVDFHEFYKKGYALVVAGIDIEYHNPLKAAYEFYVTTEIDSFDEKRMHFLQQIKLKRNDKLAAKAIVHIACIDNKTGKSCMPEILRSKLPEEKYTQIEA